LSGPPRLFRGTLYRPGPTRDRAWRTRDPDGTAWNGLLRLEREAFMEFAAKDGNLLLHPRREVAAERVRRFGIEGAAREVGVIPKRSYEEADGH
jgi:hypothetical protein